MTPTTEAKRAGLRVAWVWQMRQAYLDAEDALQGSLWALMALRRMPDADRVEFAKAMAPEGWTVVPVGTDARSRDGSDLSPAHGVLVGLAVGIVAWVSLAWLTNQVLAWWAGA